jgi:hypothetical protein
MLEHLQSVSLLCVWVHKSCFGGEKDIFFRITNETNFPRAKTLEKSSVLGPVLDSDIELAECNIPDILRMVDTYMSRFAGLHAYPAHLNNGASNGAARLYQSAQPCERASGRRLSRIIIMPY